ncbi:MAG TPA: hypothetical protein DG754_02110, partial [Bacteroidales bacterium]|nr:hypothetical protein [Bacteroidales bacterium]
NYHVTVTDINGCQGEAEVNLTFYIHDIMIAGVVAPVSGCELNDEEPVTIALRNNGTYSFPEGTILNLGFLHEGITHSEGFVLQQEFDIDEEMTVTLNETVDLSEPKTHSIGAWVVVDNDMVPDNNSLLYTVDSYPPVNFSFNMDDEISIYLPFTLDA